MNETAGRPTTDAELFSRDFIRRVESIVKKLRQLADRAQAFAVVIEHASHDRPRRHTRAAEDLLADLAWGMANLHAHELVAAAVEADDAEREERENGPSS